MQLTLLAITSLLSASALAAPAAAAPATLTTRASPGLYLCQNRNFNEVANFCFHYTQPWGQCTTITDRFPPDARGVSSAGADQGNWCTLYENEGCTGPELQVYNPGYKDLSSVGWNDRAKSFNCARI